MRCYDHVGAAKKRRLLAQRFRRDDIERGAAEMTGIERRDQCGLVDQGAAGRIDEVRALFHSSKCFGVEQSTRLGRQRRMHGNEIRGFEKPFETHQFDAELPRERGRNIGIVRDHFEAERLRFRSDTPRNVAQADQAYTWPSSRRMGTTAGISHRPCCTSELEKGTFRASASTSAIA